MDDTKLSRRQVATAGAAALGVAAAALSGCSGAGGAGADPAPGSSRGTGAAGGANASGPGAVDDAPSTVRPPTVDGPDPEQAVPLAELVNLPVGGAIAATGTDGTPIVIARPEAARVVAFSAICPHLGCTVNPAGRRLTCACHNSVFDAFTGARAAGPAVAGLPRIAVMVQGENVVAGQEEP